MARALSYRMRQVRADLITAGENGLRASPTNSTLCALEARGLATTNPLADRLLTVQWLSTELGETVTDR